MSKFCGGCGAALAGDVRFCESCGKPTALPARQPAAGQAPAQRPMSSTAPTVSKRPLVVAGIVLGVLVVLGAGMAVVQKMVFSPEAVVERYFADLAAGDGAGAKQRLADGGVGTDETSAVDSLSGNTAVLSTELLVDKAVASDSYQAPENVEVTASSDDPEQPSVRVAYQLDGKERSATMMLRQAPEKVFLVFKTWQIASGGTTQLFVPGYVPYQVNGIAMKHQASEIGGGTDAGVPPVGFVVFPGGYDVGIAAKNPLVSGGSKKAYAVLGKRSNVMVHATLKESAKAEVDAQVRAYIDKCAEKTTLQPENCPFSNGYTSDDTARNVHWTVSSYPVIALQQDPGGAVYVETPSGSEGEANVTYEQKEFFGEDYEQQSASSPITVSGFVLVKKGKIDWQSPADQSQS